MWDFFICFSIGAHHELEGVKIFLVTGDTAIQEAARVAKSVDRVLSLEDYLKSVGVT